MILPEIVPVKNLAVRGNNLVPFRSEAAGGASDRAGPASHMWNLPALRAWAVSGPAIAGRRHDSKWRIG